MNKNSDKYEFAAPASLKEAKDRVRELTTGVMNVEKQLGDRRRSKTMPEPAYDTWREKTKAARIFMVAELRFVKEWMLERRRKLLAKDADVWPPTDPRTMLQRAVTEGRKHIRGEENALAEVLDAIDLYLNHDA